MDKEKLSDTEAAELRAVYHVIHDDIKYGKRLQWTTTYYALLTFAAIVGFAKLIYDRMGHTCPDEKLEYAWFFVVLACLVNLVAIYNLMLTQYRLTLYRMQLTKTELLMTEKARYAIDLHPGRRPKKRIDKITTYNRYLPDLIVTFVILLSIGLFSVLWYVFHHRFWVILICVVVLDGLCFFLSWRCFNRKANKKRSKVFKPTLDSTEE
jgi:hypothetical protein